MSGASKHGQRDGRDQELERLRKLVRDLELEARGRHQRRDRDNREMRDDSVGNRGEESSSQSSPRRLQDRSLSRESHRHRNCSCSQETRQRWNCSRLCKYDSRGSDSPEERQSYNADMDAMSQALRRAARLPFSNEIKQALMHTMMR